MNKVIPAQYSTEKVVDLIVPPLTPGKQNSQLSESNGTSLTKALAEPSSGSKRGSELGVAKEGSEFKMMEGQNGALESKKRPILSVVLAIIVAVIYGVTNFVYASLSSKLGIDAVFLFGMPMLFLGVGFHIFKIIQAR
mmetsp:Transcript_14562/g.24852  ORF Transcript_14562/g.24852 Transcript_14562/m.24852 type:complete len:138 (+) Transcript_14562:54-467(+)